MTACLDGVRVLDLSRVLAGPSVTQMLADLGADVIKVERPGAGDESRTQGARPAARPGANIEDTSGFSAVNRGKRSIALDLASVQGQAIARRLAAESNILVENFKTDDLKRYPLDRTADAMTAVMNRTEGQSDRDGSPMRPCAKGRSPITSGRNGATAVITARALAPAPEAHR